MEYVQRVLDNPWKTQHVKIDTCLSVDLHVHLDELLAAVSTRTESTQYGLKVGPDRCALFEYGKVLFCMCVERSNKRYQTNT